MYSSQDVIFHTCMQQEETWDHLFSCTDEQNKLQELIDTVKSINKEQKVTPELSELLVTTFLNTKGIKANNAYPSNLSRIVASQTRIKWDCMFQGQFSVLWTEAHSTALKQRQLKDDPRLWLRKIAIALYKWWERL